MWCHNAFFSIDPKVEKDLRKKFKVNVLKHFRLLCLMDNTACHLHSAEISYSCHLFYSCNGIHPFHQDFFFFFFFVTTAAVFQFDGPIKVLHTMMVDPNCSIKKPGAKDLPVTQGEILDVIQLTNSKKALCRNKFGKCM